MELQLITPELAILNAQVTQVIVPGTMGEFGVLPGHAPLISTLRPGMIQVDLAEGGTRRIAVLSGLAEVTPERCIILAESAMDFTGFTADEAKSRLQAARIRHQDATSPHEEKLAENEILMGEIIAASMSVGLSQH